MKKILMVIGGFVIAILVIAIIAIAIVSAASKTLVCKSDEGNITIMYNKKEITSYIAKNISYDLDEQKAYAKQVGIDAYLDEFSLWFSNNTTGTCSR